MPRAILSFLHSCELSNTVEDSFYYKLDQMQLYGYIAVCWL